MRTRGEKDVPWEPTASFHGFCPVKVIRYYNENTLLDPTSLFEIRLRSWTDGSRSFVRHDHVVPRLSLVRSGRYAITIRVKGQYLRYFILKLWQWRDRNVVEKLDEGRNALFFSGTWLTWFNVSFFLLTMSFIHYACKKEIFWKRYLFRTFQAFVIFW